MLKIVVSNYIILFIAFPGQPDNEKPIWALKEVGDKMQYNTIGGNGAISYSTVLIKNLRWNGSYCVARNGSFTNIYIGDGSRLGGVLYSPLQIVEIEKDPIGDIEQSEPNPDKEPVIIEPNTDIDGMGDMDNVDADMDMDD